MAFSLAAVAAECKDGACPLPAAGGEATYTVLSPVPESAVEPIKPALRLKSLDGKTIALVGGSFMANVTHPELKRLILAEYPTAKVYVLSEIGSARPYPRPDLKPNTPQATRQNRSRPTARGEGRGGNGAGGASRRHDGQGSERGRRGPPSADQQHQRFRRFRGNAPQDAPRQ